MAVTKFRNFEHQARAESKWLVCETAAIPVATAALGEKIAAELSCECPHEVMTLDLRPINFGAAFDFHRAHAWAHSANSVTRGVLEPRVSGYVSRYDDETEPVRAIINRAIAMAERARR